jgi:prepilin-type N-terminal cleavage/methylation domain-containing protein
MKAARDITSRGFTLVELLVSIGIFTLITTMAVVNHTQFNGSVLLTNLAYEIGLSVREAQVYGITVRQSGANPIKFDSGYGIHFDLGTSNTMYTLFEDVKPAGGVADHVYSEGTDGAGIQIFRIQKGNRISKICVRNNCSSSTDFENRVDISFIRPNPDAYIRAAGNSSPLNFAQICIASPGGSVRKVMVESTGQISVVADDVSICNN